VLARLEAQHRRVSGTTGQRPRERRRAEKEIAMHTDVNQARSAIADNHDQQPGDVELRELLVTSLLAAPVGAGLPLSAIYRVTGTLLVRAYQIPHAARTGMTEHLGPVVPR
jgi:hypothetical protein